MVLGGLHYSSGMWECFFTRVLNGPPFSSRGEQPCRRARKQWMTKLARVQLRSWEPEKYVAWRAVSVPVWLRRAPALQTQAWKGAEARAERVCRSERRSMQSDSRRPC
jgi:hypothetical protein